MRAEMIEELKKLQRQTNITDITALHALGKAHRNEVPIATLGQRPVIQRDPVAFIRAIEGNLIQELLPQRHQKMAANPAAFFRGTAELMAYDLSHEPQSQLRVLTDGDVHLQNFGFYASPERNMLFDLNDFDEAAPNSFEFDVKRLATSIYLFGGQEHYGEQAMDDLVQDVARTYRKTLKKAFKTGALERFYASTAVSNMVKELPDEAAGDFVRNVVRKAANRDNESVVKKFTVQSGTHLRFKDDPPRSVHLGQGQEIALMNGFLQYQQSTRADVALLLGQYHITDIIRHSVGIGSFGTSCYLILLTGLGGSHLVLQVKEALPRRRDLLPERLTVDLDREISEGQRIISSTQILQKASDPFLGWFNMDGKSFYVRQFRDMKGSIDVTALPWDQYQAYCRVCGYLLAMAHAQSPMAAVVAGYMNKEFDDAIQHWAKDYLHQVTADYAAFIEQFNV